MLSVELTTQEKKDVAVVYGFLVDVWLAQKAKHEQNQSIARGISKHTVYNNTAKRGLAKSRVDNN